MVKNVFLIIICAALFSLSACKNKNGLLPGSTGTPYELLVIMDKAQWEAAPGRTLFGVVDSDVPGLPQSEPNFKLSYATPDRFGSLLKPVRNIIIATIDPEQFTQPKITFSEDVWAENQLVIYVNSPDGDSFSEYLKVNGQKIIDAFVQKEISRMEKVIAKKYNRSASEELRDYLGVNMKIPTELKVSKKGQDFYWITSQSKDQIRNIVVYTYPYTDANTFTVDYLVHKRDSFMKANIPGGPKDSYMSTQHIYRPDSIALNVHGRYTLELRGLWDIVGDNMGGSFVSHTELDEKNNRVVTVEAFLYRPGKEKRNIMRALEAALYTLKPGTDSSNGNDPTAVPAE